MTGTPGRSTSQPTITVIWKKPNQTRSPTKTHEDEEMYSDCRSGADQEMDPVILESLQDEEKQATLLMTTDEKVSGVSNATNKIENLQLTSPLSDGSTLEDSRSLDTASLIEFPPLCSKLLESIFPLPQTLTQNHRAKPSQQTTPPSIPKKRWEKGNLIQRNGTNLIELTQLLATSGTENNINNLSTKTRPSTSITPSWVESSMHTRNPPASSNFDKVQYNPYLRQSTSKSVKSTHENNSKQLDKKMILKKGVTRTHIHRYDLRLKVKQFKIEDEEFRALQQALQKFLDISLQVDPSSTIPPFFELDRNDKSVPDINSKHQVPELDSLALLKRYFSRLSNRSNKGNIHCGLILPQNISFQEFMDKARLYLANLEY